MANARTGQAAVDQLVELFTLEQIEVDIFRGRSPEISLQRVFGGQVAGQALVAAGASVPDQRRVHSLHSYFIRPGDPTVPIVYTAERVRDGSSFSVRRVVAVQHGKPIFFMSASFHRHEEGLDHAEPMPDDLPDPDSLPRLHDRLPKSGLVPKMAELSQPIDVRYVGTPGWMADRPAERRQRVWMRADGVLPDDPLFHACALTFASDITLLDAVLAYHGEAWGKGGFGGASLDHAIWFHRPFKADDWLLYDCLSPTASGARGLATGRFYSRTGEYVATVVQEGLLRRIPDFPRPEK